MLVLAASVVDTCSVALQPKRRGLFSRRRGGSLIPGPLLPAAGFFSVMSAPIYGKDLFPGGFLGGKLDLDSLTPRLSPNEYLVAPADSVPNFQKAGAREESKVFDVDVDTLKTAFLRMVESQYLVKAFAQPTISDDATLQYVFVQRTPLLRFPDIINVRFLSLGPSSSTLILHSGSIYGYDDIGKNKARVQEWLSGLDQELALPGSAVGTDSIDPNRVVEV